MGLKLDKEFLRMVTEVDLTDRDIWARFEIWKHLDGSKEGLQSLLAIQKKKKVEER